MYGWQERLRAKEEQIVSEQEESASRLATITDLQQQLDSMRQQAPIQPIPETIHSLLTYSRNDIRPPNLCCPTLASTPIPSNLQAPNL